MASRWHTRIDYSLSDEPNRAADLDHDEYYYAVMGSGVKRGQADIIFGLARCRVLGHN